MIIKNSKAHFDDFQSTVGSPIECYIRFFASFLYQNIFYVSYGWTRSYLVLESKSVAKKIVTDLVYTDFT